MNKIWARTADSDKVETQMKEEFMYFYNPREGITWQEFIFIFSRCPLTIKFFFITAFGFSTYIVDEKLPLLLLISVT